MSKFTYTTRKDGRLMKKVSKNGKTKYLYASNPKELEKLYNEYIHLTYVGINDDNILLKDFTQKWLNVNSAGKEIRTIQDYKYLINNYIIPNLGYKKLKDIKIYDVKELMKKMEKTPTTAKKTLQVVKRILNDAVDNDLIIKNVAANIKPPKIVKNEKLPISLYDDNKLLNSNNKYASFFILMRYTGMRREEIVPLLKSDINLEKKTISINKAVTFLNNQPVLKTTKNTKSRIVPILDIIYPMVKELYDNTDDLIFKKESDGKMLTESAVKRHLESFLHDTDMKFTCHQLRHSYCTMLYYSGIGIKKAQELMGHSSADMVYNIYAHLDQEREKADETINNYINELSNSCQNK